MFGYSPEEADRPAAPNLLISENARQRHSEHHRVYFANMQTRPMGAGLQFGKGRRKDGKTFPVEIGLSVIATSTGKLGVAFVSDITQRKQMEQAARAHTEQVQALAASLLQLRKRSDEECRVSCTIRSASNLLPWPWTLNGLRPISRLCGRAKPCCGFAGAHNHGIGTAPTYCI